jgi:hypothetical protein
MLRLLLALGLMYVVSVSAQDAPVTFKSGVALARVDAQVLDENGRTVSGLQATDFVLRIDGHIVPIRNFASENMPIDILLLLDVSGSMQPHVERIATAAQQALDVLAAKDRVAIMVFDTYTRLRLSFRSSHNEVTGELNQVLGSERFNGGTQITRALLDAASYVKREARPEARRAIVILTDDETQDAEDEARVESALSRANAVLSFLQAPYEPPTITGGGRRRGTWGSGGGGWPGGGGIGFPGGGPVILGPGRRGGYGGDPSHTAGTASIASDSGGDTINVDQASALEDTLARLRQRYTLNFYFPQGSPDRSSVRVDLSQEARIRYMDAEVRSRQVFLSGSGSGERAGPTIVTRAQQTGISGDSTQSQDQSTPETTRSRHHSVAVNEDYGERVNTIDNNSGGSTHKSDGPTEQVAPAIQHPAAKQPAAPETPPRSGWPRADQQTPKPN